MELLKIDTLPSRDPLEFFNAWLKEVTKTNSFNRTMIVSTANKDGRPSSRVMVLGRVDRSGLKFSTSTQTMKYQELVRVAGRVTWEGPEAERLLWNALPKPVQIIRVSATTGEVVPNLEEYNERRRQTMEKFKDVDTLPDGVDDTLRVFNLAPDWWEFASLQDNFWNRVVFRRPTEGEEADGRMVHQGEQGWLIEFLAP